MRTIKTTKNNNISTQSTATLIEISSQTPIAGDFCGIRSKNIFDELADKNENKIEK